MCDGCGFTVVAGLPPDFCPECGAQGNFTNRTCYVPEMGASDMHDLNLCHG
jgi:rRNA maturation endonuclease Nob1